MCGKLAMQHLNYELSVLVNGRPIREYGHRGITFVEGRRNKSYTIKFRNNLARRVLAVVSIDGIDVVDGKNATQESRGYVVPAYASVEIKGWRTSTEKVNDFVFTNKPEGYSAQTQGDDSNSGVIAVKVFDEVLSESELSRLLRTVHHYHYPVRIVTMPAPYWSPSPNCPESPTVWCDGIVPGNTTVGSILPNSGMGVAYSCSLGNQVKEASVTPPETVKSGLMPAPVPPQENPDFNLGTGWGSEREDRVDMVDFKRSIELCTMEIYYSDAEGLAKSGIEVDKKPAVVKSVLPKGFNGFCVPPKVTKTKV
jgi:hypothetical protein